MRRKGSIVGDLFNMDVLFGILLGITIPFLVLVGMGGGIKEWEDLTAGILGVLGGAGAVIGVMHQIRHAQDMEDERRVRSMQSARTMMPQALSVLCGYAKECCKALSAITNGRAPDANHVWGDLPNPWNPTNVPDSPMPILKECAQFGDRDIQTRIAELIQSLQVQASRLSGLEDLRVMGEVSYFGRIDDALEIYARATALFDYARMVTDEAPPKPAVEDMYTAAHLCGFHRGHWPQLEEQLRRTWSPDP